MKEGERGPFFPNLRIRIKDNNSSPHGKFYRFLFPFSSKFSDLNFASYVFYILIPTWRTQWAWVTCGLNEWGDNYTREKGTEFDFSLQHIVKVTIYVWRGFCYWSGLSFVNLIRSDPIQSGPPRFDPVWSWFCQQPSNHRNWTSRLILLCFKGSQVRT